MYNQRGTVAPGKYTFPFQYQLPISLPGTFIEEGETWGGGKAYKALVMYKAKAWIDVPFKHDCKYTERIVVSEKVEPGATPSFAENSKHFVTASGALKARVWLDKVRLRAGSCSGRHGRPHKRLNPVPHAGRRSTSPARRWRSSWRRTTRR